MKYMVFWGDTYYPHGGMKDKHKWFENFELAVNFAEGVLVGKGSLTWVHVCNVESNEIVYENEDMS